MSQYAEKYVQEDLYSAGTQSIESPDEPSVPQGLWRRCNKCGHRIYVDDVKANFYICPKCHGYFRVHAYRRIEMIVDEGTFEEWNKEMPFENPLNFPGYEKKVKGGPGRRRSSTRLLSPERERSAAARRWLRSATPASS